MKAAVFNAVGDIRLDHVSATEVPTEVEPMSAAYESCDRREPGWIKLEPRPAA